MTSPESLFASLLARKGAGGELDLDELCREHPAHAQALRELFHQWLKLEDIRKRFGMSGSLTERLRSVHGAGVDPQVELEGEVSGDFTEQLVDRLSGRASSSERYTLKGEVGRGGMGG